MKRTIAIPTAGGRSCPHFGHCEAFTLIETDDGVVTAERVVRPPAHEPGAFPRFLADAGVDVVLAGGMGVRARDLFAANAIAVHTGIGEEEPRGLAERFLRDELAVGPNRCNHGAPDHAPSCGPHGDEP